jgi:hypothetical protein
MLVGRRPTNIPQIIRFEGPHWQKRPYAIAQVMPAATDYAATHYLMANSNFYQVRLRVTRGK